MIIGIVVWKASGTYYGVVEWPEGVEEKEILKNWVASQGLPEHAVGNYRLDACAVVPWAELGKTLTPIKPDFMVKWDEEKEKLVRRRKS